MILFNSLNLVFVNANIVDIIPIFDMLILFSISAYIIRLTKIRSSFGEKIGYTIIVNKKVACSVYFNIRRHKIVRDKKVRHRRYSECLISDVIHKYSNKNHHFQLQRQSIKLRIVYEWPIRTQRTRRQRNQTNRLKNHTIRYAGPQAMIFCQMSTQCTWGRLAAICRCKESRSFSASCSLISVSPSLSWVSRKLSINLSRSSNIDTISCSKLASSPENCELRWLMLSSEIVGITSHIIFHMSATQKRALNTLYYIHYTYGRLPIYVLHYYYLKFTRYCDIFMSLLFSDRCENL